MSVASFALTLLEPPGSRGISQAMQVRLLSVMTEVNSHHGDDAPTCSSGLAGLPSGHEDSCYYAGLGVLAFVN